MHGCTFSIIKLISMILEMPLHNLGDEIRNPVVFMIPSTESGSGVGGHGMHNGCDFWN